MNLLLVEPGEVVDGVVTLADRRAVHLRTVLGAGVGAIVKIGVIGGGVGTATVESDDGMALRARIAIAADAPGPQPMAVELVLAVPRPKALSRALEAAATFGVSRITLTNAWRVDKSYLKSPRLDPAAMALAARLGAEQGATTHLPPITLHARFMELLDTRWPDPPTTGKRTRLGGEPTRLVAHPGAPPIESAVRDTAHVIAIGPEGGWIDRELETFVARDFKLVSLGAPILRVETALATALGQLALLARLRER